jgi:hypothetical protein
MIFYSVKHPDHHESAMKQNYPIIEMMQAVLHHSNETFVIGLLSPQKFCKRLKALTDHFRGGSRVVSFDPFS